MSFKPDLLDSFGEGVKVLATEIASRYAVGHTVNIRALEEDLQLLVEAKAAKLGLTTTTTTIHDLVDTAQVLLEQSEHRAA